MFNPQYFINVLGSKGRNLLERYLPEVPKAEVLAQLSDQTRALLEKQEFLSAEAYSKQLREQVTDIEKDMVYIQGQIEPARLSTEGAGTGAHGSSGKAYTASGANR